MNYTEEHVKSLAQNILICQNNMDGQRFDAWKASFDSELWERAMAMAMYWKRSNREDALLRSKS